MKSLFHLLFRGSPGVTLHHAVHLVHLERTKTCTGSVTILGLLLSDVNVSDVLIDRRLDFSNLRSLVVALD